ncbi:MAG: hypothetical protein H6733_07170 [Alphaproteobacteria bacterium]|nr:hypothetical protein [Alphaproteobacteria bacterium]
MRARLRTSTTIGWGVAFGLALGGCADDPDADLPDSLTRVVLRDCPAVAGTICPFAGTGVNGFNGEGLDRLESWFSMPMSVEISPYGKPVFADWNNHKLRMLEDDGTLTTIMGTSFIGDGDFEGQDLVEGAAGTDINLNHPTQQRYFPSGVLLSASWHTHKLRIWDPITHVGRVIIGGAYGFSPPESDPPGTPQSAVGAELNQPRWVEIDSKGDVWIVDMRNLRLRKLDMSSFAISTIAGSGKKGFAGTSTGGVDCTSEDALQTCFAFPDSWNPIPGGAIQLNADETLLYVADSEANTIRELDLTTGHIRILAGASGVAGDAVGAGPDARFSFPSSIALDRDTNTLFVADTDNNRIKAIDLTTEQVSVFAGTGEATCPGADASSGVVVCEGQELAGDGGDPLDATFFRPFGVDLDLDGNVVVADTFNHRFRVIYR